MSSPEARDDPLDDVPTPTVAALRVVPPGPEVDLVAAERAASQFMRALGLDTTAAGLERTPRRVARAYAELFSPREFELTTFPNDGGYDELVMARRIPVRSVCEHHLLPFVGVAVPLPPVVERDHEQARCRAVL
jgi:GTP cyclohydrolase I